MTIERGCTNEIDESLYKCETLEDGSRSETFENSYTINEQFNTNVVFHKKTLSKYCHLSLCIVGLAFAKAVVAMEIGRVRKASHATIANPPTVFIKYF